MIAWRDIPAGEGVSASTARFTYAALEAVGRGTQTDISALTALSIRTTGQALRWLANTGRISATHTTDNGLRRETLYEATKQRVPCSEAIAEQGTLNGTNAVCSATIAEQRKSHSEQVARSATIAEQDSERNNPDRQPLPNSNAGIVFNSSLNPGVEEKSKDKEDPKGFTEFWKSYPSGKRKVDRKGCLRIWRRDGLEKKADEIIAGLLRWIPVWQTDGFIPMVTTFLNQERWDAHPERDRPATGSNGTRNGHHDTSDYVVRPTLQQVRDAEAWSDRHQ